jgi:hypothetical protein
MNLKLLQGYGLAVLSLLILVAAGFILLNNAGDDWPLHVFWKTVTLSRSLWLLLAALGGVVLWWTLTKLLPGAVSALRAGMKSRREKEAKQQLKDLSARQKKERAQ